MNAMSRTLLVTRVLAAAALVPAALGAQEQPVGRSDAEVLRNVARLVAEPASLTLVAGQTVPIRVYAVDAQGNVINDAPMRVSGARNAVFVGGDRGSQSLTGKGLKAGKYELVASTASRAAGAPAPVTLTIPVTVTLARAVARRGHAGAGAAVHRRDAGPPRASAARRLDRAARGGDPVGQLQPVDR